MTSCTATDVTILARAGNPVERFDAIIMDRPWLFHWKKAFIFVPIQGLLIATGMAANRGMLLLADGSVTTADMSYEPLDHAQAPWWGMRVTSWSGSVKPTPTAGPRRTPARCAGSIPP